MPHCVTLIRYTSQGVTKIKESPSRLDAARKAAEKEGGNVHQWYLTMGRYDAVLISEFPSDEACAKFTLSAGALAQGWRVWAASSSAALVRLPQPGAD